MYYYESVPKSPKVEVRHNKTDRNTGRKNVGNSDQCLFIGDRDAFCLDTFTCKKKRKS